MDNTEELKKQIQVLQTEIKSLKDENKNMAALLNNHARLIDRNSGEIKQLDRNLRNEINRIAAAFKKVQSMLSRGKE